MTVLPDIPRLYTALAEWLSCFLYILVLRRKVSNRRLAVAAVLGFALQCAVQHVAGRLSLIFWLPGMAVAVGMMLFSFWSMCRLSLRECVYYTARAFVLAEFAAALEWQLYSYYYPGIAPGELISVVYLLLAFLWIYGVYALINWKIFKGRNVKVTPWAAASSCITVLTVFFMSNISYLPLETPFRGMFSQEIFYIRTLVDFCGIVLLLSQQEQQLAAEAQYEVGAMELVLHQQYEQYRQTRESIDLVNRKYHDLKHQIAVIRAENSPEKKESYLREMEHGIRMVDSQYKTGNDVLDTVLSGKAMYCADHEISFNCVADGALLRYMDTMDLCTLFGNALDNAIEYLEQIKDTEKRLLRVAVCAQNSFVLIRFENYCDTPLQFVDGVPRTTKGDWGYHGYGVKSIFHTAEKYGGTVTIRTEENWFRLCVLLPLDAK